MTGLQRGDGPSSESHGDIVMRASPLLTVLLIALLQNHGRAAQSALDALKMLPKGAEKNLARIVAQEGTPAPERWHILVHDAKSENGLREFVVAGGKLVAARELSQFAEKLTSDDVIGAEAVRVDSDTVTILAEKYAVANNVSISSMNYELRKENARPIWRVDCLDARGQKIGALRVAAGGGRILSREGFPNEPAEKVTRVDRDPPAPVATSDAAPTNTFAPTTPTTQLPKERFEKERSDSAPQQIAKSPVDHMEEPATTAAPRKNKPKVDERTVRRSDERLPDAVAEPQVGPEDRGEIAPPVKAVAKKKPKADVRRAVAANGKRDESFAGQPQGPTTERTETVERGGAPELEPFVDSPPRRPSVVRRIVRHLLPF